ncbi:actin cortical patch SUR7/pH-response regulator pali [Sordaria brevicollis]|uniref:Actin cortical patch SUR7/pH-response regulator pali n=1 Tax=Sordaria brevicollis TaxID=83679 RepID=A0AAE0NV01_SORBR|nr:actin cortical patch SUR7/pH-response regulator pali [Sordaria brevicollis]
MRHPSTFVPIIASIVAFVLVLLALIAGSSSGFMESYDIITFNTSLLGQNLITQQVSGDQPGSRSDELCEKLGFLSDACKDAAGAVGDAKDDVLNTLGDMGNDIADQLAEKLGIHEFYSLHARTVCEGEYSPNPTAKGADRSVAKCIKTFPNGFNVSDILDKELRLGPFQLTLQDIGFDDQVQSAFDTLNRVIKAFAIILIVDVALTGLVMLASLLAIFFLNSKERPTPIINAVLSSIAFFLVLVTGILATVGSRIGASKANEYGKDIGLSAKAGTNYTILIWVAVGFSLITFVGWVFQALRYRNGKTMGRRHGHHMGRHHKGVRDSEESGANSERPVWNRGMREVQFPRTR